MVGYPYYCSPKEMHKQNNPPIGEGDTTWGIYTYMIQLYIIKVVFIVTSIH